MTEELKLLRQVRWLLLIAVVLLLLPYLWGALDFLSGGRLTVWAQKSYVEKLQEQEDLEALDRWREKNK